MGRIRAISRSHTAVTAAAAAGAALASRVLTAAAAPPRPTPAALARKALKPLPRLHRLGMWVGVELRAVRLSWDVTRDWPRKGLIAMPRLMCSSHGRISTDTFWAGRRAAYAVGPLRRAAPRHNGDAASVEERVAGHVLAQAASAPGLANIARVP